MTGRKENKPSSLIGKGLSSWTSFQIYRKISVTFWIKIGLFCCVIWALSNLSDALGKKFLSGRIPIYRGFYVTRKLIQNPLTHLSWLLRYKKTDPKSIAAFTDSYRSKRFQICRSRYFRTRSLKLFYLNGFLLDRYWFLRSLGHWVNKRLLLVR